ncbi:MAG: TolC family protein [Verrucomicrobiales bacterium]|nr:TolC family protein [Verrucomicrobiales bacterium]
MKALIISFPVRPLGICLLISCSVAGALRAADSDPAHRSLSLSDCFQLALKHNLDLKIERLSGKIAQHRLDESRGVYDPTFNISATRDFLDQPSMFDRKKEEGDVPYQLTSDIFSGGISGKLPTGLTYDLNGALTKWKALTDLRDLGVPGTGFRNTNEYGLSSGIFLKQPLLKDFWTDADRMKIQVSRKNLQISENNLVSRMMATVGAVQAAYFDALHAQEVVKVHRVTLESANQLLSEVRSRIQSSALAPIEEKLFDYYAVNVAASVVDAERAETESEHNLRRLLIEDVKDLQAGPLDLTDPFFEIEEQFDQMGSWRDAMTKRPDVQQLKVEMEKQDIVLRYDRNQLFPSLDLVGSYGLTGIDPELGGASRQVRRGVNSFYGYGVTMSIPLSNRSARNRYRATQEEKQQSLLRMKKLELDILSEVENAGKQMSAAYRRIAPSRRAAQLAEEVLRAEQSKIQLGQPNGLAVVEARRRLTSAQISSLNAVLEYNKARTKLSLLEGEILERNKIEVDVKE